MPDQNPAVFPFDIATLISEGRFADRFSYSSYFIPVRIGFKDAPAIPILTFPQKEWISRFGSKLPDEVMNRWLHDMELSQLTKLNHVEIRPQVVNVTPPRVVVTTPSTPSTPSTTSTPESLDRTVDELRAISSIISTGLREESKYVSTLLAATVTKLERDTAVVTAYAAKAAPPGDSQATPSIKFPRMGEAGGTSDDEGKDLLLTLIQSEIGYLFLDRTRIRPKGFAVGEHIYSLSLAPSEEVTLEQKSYSKRTETMEEANEREQSMDLELASTLTSELNESMDRTRSLTDKWGLNISHSGAYKSPPFFWGSLEANHTGGYTKDVTEASSETARRSIKDSKSTSSKISAKYRSLHKVTFSVKTETGFESTSKRIIRNQNRFTPVDYHFFKILRVVEMSQERYGAMLCWAPFVKDPAARFFARLQVGKNEILGRAKTQIPAEPQEPKKVTGTKSNRIWSSQVEADRWGTLGEMKYQTYTLSIAIPQGWEWDELPVELRTSVELISGVWGATHGAYVVGSPWIEEGQLKVHVTAWARNAVERNDVDKKSRIWLMVRANFTQVSAADPVEEASYAAAYADYLIQRKTWTEESAKISKDAADAAAKWEAAMLANSNPVNELVDRLISEHFSRDVQDEGAEIELWQRIFQWDAASYVLYPGYWTGGSLRDPLGDPNSFFNASWARLFLPIRPGMEAMALRWIFSKTVHRPLDSGLDVAIVKVVEDLEENRKNYATTVTPSTTLGGCPDVKETYVCLGRWEETLPTDGTHIEVTQSASLSIDSFAQTDLEDTAKLRDAVLESHQQDVEIKKKTAGGITGAATVEVKIRTDAGSGRSADSKTP